jgi:hypothetical protein
VTHLLKGLDEETVFGELEEEIVLLTSINSHPSYIDIVYLLQLSKNNINSLIYPFILPV